MSANEGTKYTVVGTIMCNTKALAYVVEKLEEDDFYFTIPAVIFNTCVRIYDRKETVDVNNVYSELLKDKETEDICSGSGLANIISAPFPLTTDISSTLS
jgi:replicative DNA helicase